MSEAFATEGSALADVKGDDARYVRSLGLPSELGWRLLRVTDLAEGVTRHTSDGNRRLQIIISSHGITFLIAIESISN